ncbi:hypothetical protein [Nocardioides piscis]|uniref:Uncharacterized protein n=1 Tax=Nocardioides piscis TaxID=2714938 RepID=A0A6G7YCS2_9ACTN|nr:hypothetical protein [Nocardioides piscis]QIK74704.1 hypothetical protein G7071_03980 [Nocardioides piscis]
MTSVPAHDQTYYDRNGQPIDADGHARLQAHADYPLVGRDQAGEQQVVTAWRGTDQRTGGVGGEEPLIFSTITRTDHSAAPVDGEVVLAATEQDALANHFAILIRRRAELG